MKLTAFFLVILALVGIGYYFKTKPVRSANYGWAQTTWQGGASTTAIAKHSTDQSGWTKYQSTNNLISTSTNGQISLKATSTFWTDTTNTDFNGASASSSVYASNGAVYLKKPNGVSCTTNNECESGGCYNNTCSWCAGKILNNYCLYLGVTDQSCAQTCSSHNGSIGAYYDDSSCTAMKLFGYACSNCFSYVLGVAPYYVNSNGACNYGTGSGWNVDAVLGGMSRLCACVK